MWRKWKWRIWKKVSWLLLTNQRRFLSFLIFFMCFDFCWQIDLDFWLFYFLCITYTYLGNYRRKLPQALKQLEAEFWPNGLDKPPVLDKTHPWLVYECPDGSYEVINGNHRKILFERNATAPSTWPCRVIPKEEVFLCFFMCWQT